MLTARFDVIENLKFFAFFLELNKALSIRMNFLDTVALSFVFDNYYSIMD